MYPTNHNHSSKFSLNGLIQKTSSHEEPNIPKPPKPSKESPTKYSMIENEILEIKKDVKELKNSINELVVIMKKLYEFDGK